MFRIWWGIVMSIFLGACAGTARSGFYRLASQPFPQMIDDAGVPLAIFIVHVSIPEVLDRPEFVVRISDSQIRVDESARWAEPLKDQIVGVVAADLRELFLDALVLTTPQKSNRLTVRLAIDVQTFDFVPGKQAVLVINWWIITPASKHSFVAKSVIVEQVDGTGYDPIVEAYNQALAAFSTDVAITIMAELRKNSSLAANHNGNAVNATL